MTILKSIRKLFDNAGFPPDSAAKTIPGAGSDREFTRISDGCRTAILMSGTGHGASLDDWLDVQRYLSDLRFGVPEVYAYDLDIPAPAIVVEDLGEMPPPSIEDYPLVIRELARLAVIGGEHIKKCPVVADRPFDFEAFRWESQYFSEQYLAGYKGILRNKIEEFAPQFDGLAKKLGALPKAFCHRDFQSSNIAVIDGRIRIIDFQSAKFGPPEYDLASLLWDSRVDIADDMKEGLTDAYIVALGELDYPVEPERFRENLRYAAISRMMQALGAYCFLSRVKGKEGFIKLIRPAENRLRGLLNRLRYIVGLIEYI